MEKLIPYYELIILGILTIGILILWLGKYLRNKYYIHKSRKALKKTEKMFGISASSYVSFWKKVLDIQEKQNQL